MALKSAQLAGLGNSLQPMPPVYQFPRQPSKISTAPPRLPNPQQCSRDSMTSVGLLCRMYLGWGKDKKAGAPGGRQVTVAARPIDVGDFG
jgi:hypothetical protein